VKWFAWRPLCGGQALCYKFFFDDDHWLEIYRIEQQDDSLRSLHFALKNANEICKLASFNSHFIAVFKLLTQLNETVFLHSEFHGVNNLIVNRHGLVVEIHHGVHSTRISDFGVHEVEFEASEDVAAKKVRGSVHALVAVRLTN
jgi:hypothetical protein